MQIVIVCGGISITLKGRSIRLPLDCSTEGGEGATKLDETGSGIGAVVRADGAGAAGVFFDDFDDNALLPHWNTPDPFCWDYNVSNSMLNVTGLNCPSHPKSPSNFTAISAPFAPQSDFRADAWMGWEAGQWPHRLVFQIAGPTGGIRAQFGYRYEPTWGPVPQIFAAASGQSFAVPAPNTGIYQFTMARIGTQVDFFFNGQPFASFTGTSGLAAGNVGFFFLGPYPGELGVCHVDRVQVVPGPGSFVLIPLLALACASRRKR